MGDKLHIFFFPLMAYGHTIPMLDIAKLFASRGITTTIVTTPLNAPIISKTIQKTKKLSTEIRLEIIKFPALEVGLPPECESVDFISSNGINMEMLNKFMVATTMLQRPFETLLENYSPSCLISDVFFPWSVNSAAKFGIPRIVFHGTSFFSLCISESVATYQPYRNVSSDSEPFEVPNLPDKIMLTRGQISLSQRQEDASELAKLIRKVKETNSKNYGVVVNSFYELEKAYADHYRKTWRRNAWSIGPVSLSNKDVEEKAQRGLKESSIDLHECLKWLNSQKPNSVLYVCFGSVANFTAPQLKEIAIGLEASGHNFIWVVRVSKTNQVKNEDWLPEGFEKRLEGKGLIIRGWAPQVLILDHEAIGGFVTHCGWNSTLEGIAAGVPMVTWPVGAEQFYNEKLITEVVKVGVSVGVQQCNSSMQTDFIINREEFQKVISRIMEGQEAEETRSKVKELATMARMAVAEGGSSFCYLNNLIEELRSVKASN